MKITDTTIRKYQAPEHFKGQMDGLTLVIDRTLPSHSPLSLRIELSKGEIGLIKFKTKHEGNPADGLLNKVMKDDVVCVMMDACDAMDRIIRLTATRPVSQRDMTRLAETMSALRLQAESIKTSVASVKE